MQVPQLGQSSDVDLGLRSNLVPNGFKPHSNDGVEALELSIPDIDILKIEILHRSTGVGMENQVSHQGMIPLQLHKHSFHAGRDRILTLAHKIRHGLIHLDNFCLTSSQGDLHRFVIPMTFSLITFGIGNWDRPRPYHHVRHVQVHQHILER